MNLNYIMADRNVGMSDSPKTKIPFTYKREAVIPSPEVSTPEKVPS